MDILRKNLLVLASAGSGKTFCLSDRVIGLMARGIEPQKIVALTFTRKAAGEFADAILWKLAEAAEEEAYAAELEAKFGMHKVDFEGLLEKVVRNLPRLTLSTMDSFFAKVVKVFQYELGLTGGRFELLEGEAADRWNDELLEALLEGRDGNTLPDEEEFVNVFRRATAGREATRVLEELRNFIHVWHGLFLAKTGYQWGPAELAGANLEDWEKGKGEHITRVRKDWPNVITTDKRQEKAFEAMMDGLERHTVGSGSLDKATSLLKSVMGAAAEGGGALEVSFYKPFTITGIGAEALRSLVLLAARCELAAALSRTRGMHGVIASYDALVESQLRRNGKLSFDDVKRLMGSWMNAEDARLRREAVDFRLDENYGHWLLDEFQDTSRMDWDALSPLIDEAMTDTQSTVFIVGDRKQAIYAWRGGEVGLFSELIDHFGKGLAVETMAESWRSCPEVLDPVNRIFGDKQTMESLFGVEAAAKWQWEEHISAEPLRDPTVAGYSRIERIAKGEKTDRVIELLKELGIGEKTISCGILMDTNHHVRELADALRGAGFQVVEEGAREPGKDHPVGLLIWQLLRWLANPADNFARQTVMMSPLGIILGASYGSIWQVVWEKLGERVSESGFAGMAGELLSGLNGTLGAFGRRRAADLLEALRNLDRQGIVAARDAADWLERIKISQSPGVAAVQVMTVHKAKGLGFDVVILPDIPSHKIPDFGHYRKVSGDGWITAAPAQWARMMIPELLQSEGTWVTEQIYEDFCKLYVAMTRAKRAMYLLVDEPAAHSAPDKSSLSNWVITSIDTTGGHTESGDEKWSNSVGVIEGSNRTDFVSLGRGIAKRRRSEHNSDASTDEPGLPSSAKGRRFGIEVHAAMEQIGWLDDEPLPVFPDPLMNTIEKLIANPKVSALFRRKGMPISLYREQPFEAMVDGRWVSGVIDRLHIHYDQDGRVNLAEIIDFKTNQLENAEELTARYCTRMRLYETAVASIYPGVRTNCIFISTFLAEIV